MSDFGRVAKKLRNLKDDLEDEVETATKRGTNTLRGQTRRELLRGDPRPSVARPKLINEVTEGRQPEKEGLLVARRVHMPEWAKYLEHGTGKHSDKGFAAPSNPPFQAIREWMLTKPVPPKEYNTVDEAAAAIAQSIADEGNEPHPFIDGAWHGPNGYRNIVDENREALRKAVRRF